MVCRAAENTAEHFSVAEFFSHMTCNFCESDLELSEYAVRALCEIRRDAIKRANEYIRRVTRFCFKRTFHRDLTFRASTAYSYRGYRHVSSCVCYTDYTIL